MINDLISTSACTRARIPAITCAGARCRRHRADRVSSSGRRSSLPTRYAQAGHARCCAIGDEQDVLEFHLSERAWSSTNKAVHARNVASRQCRCTDRACRVCSRSTACLYAQTNRGNGCRVLRTIRDAADLPQTFGRKRMRGDATSSRRPALETLESCIHGYRRFKMVDQTSRLRHAPSTPSTASVRRCGRERSADATRTPRRTAKGMRSSPTCARLTEAHQFASRKAHQGRSAPISTAMAQRGRRAALRCSPSPEYFRMPGQSVRRLVRRHASVTARGPTTVQSRRCAGVRREGRMRDAAFTCGRGGTGRGTCAAGGAPLAAPRTAF